MVWVSDRGGAHPELREPSVPAGGFQETDRGFYVMLYNPRRDRDRFFWVLPRSERTAWEGAILLAGLVLNVGLVLLVLVTYELARDRAVAMVVAISLAGALAVSFGTFFVFRLRYEELLWRSSTPLSPQGK